VKEKSKKVVFLDRDGVINEFPGNGNYVTKVKNFHFLPGALEALKILTDEKFNIFVVSNQAGVGKGVYTKQKLDKITRKMLNGVKKSGGKIKKVFYCTHRSDAGCDCRKPEIASIRSAFKILKLPMKYAKNAVFVGDTKGDMQTGHNAGCKTIFVLSGRESKKDLKKWDIKPDCVAKNLLAATKLIANGNSTNSCLGRRRAPQGR